MVLGRLPGTTTYRNVKRWANAITTPGILAIRFDATLYFANINYLKEKILQFIKKDKYPVHVLILDCTSVNQVDSSAISGLKQINKILKENYDCELLLSSVKIAIFNVLRRGGLLKEIPATNFFNQTQDAMIHAESIVQNKTAKNRKKEEERNSDDKETSIELTEVKVSQPAESKEQNLNN